MVVLAGDMNGLVGSSNVGYDGTYGCFGYGARNADGSRILEFAGPVKSTVDYGREIKLWFVTSRLFQMKSVCQSINC